MKKDKARRGAFAPEFALLAAPFFLLLMGIMELCLMEGAQQLLENAAYNASRLAKTGYIEQDKTQAETVTQVVTDRLSSYGGLLDPSLITMTQTVYSNFSGAAAGGGASGYGTAQEIVVYTLHYPWRVFTPLMCSMLGSACQEDRTFNLISTVVVRNEPYS